MRHDWNLIRLVLVLQDNLQDWMKAQYPRDDMPEVSVIVERTDLTLRVDEVDLWNSTGNEVPSLDEAVALWRQYLERITPELWESKHE